MHKRIPALFAFILFGVTALGQYKTVLSEDFKNNKRGWRLRSDSSFLVDINNGSLHLEKFRKNFDDRGCLWYNKEIDGLNTLQDFSITIYAKFISGGDIIDMFDIQWGQWDSTNRSLANSIYQLNFMLKGDVKLDYFDRQSKSRWNYSLRGKAKEILDRNLYRPNVYNKYELVQKEGFIIFNINDQQYFKQFATPIAGNSIGFQQCLKAAWEIDKIVVKQAQSNNRPVENMDSLLVKNTDSTSLGGKTGDEVLKVYPNPFINEFTVALSTTKTAPATLELLDAKGTLLLEYSRKLEPGQHTIRLFADVPAGIYFLRSTIDSKLTTTKLVKL